MDDDNDNNDNSINNNNNNNRYNTYNINEEIENNDNEQDSGNEGEEYIYINHNGHDDNNEDADLNNDDEGNIDHISGPISPSKIETKLSRAKMVKKHLIGSFLILIVVSLWVFSSIITQIIFTTESFEKPFFLTYFSTSIFSFYLFGVFINWKKWTSIPFDNENDDTVTGGGNGNRNGIKGSNGKEPLIINVDDIQSSSSSPLSISSSSSPSSNIPILNNSNILTKYKFSIKQILRISLILSPFWFLANYTYNLSLSRTSVSTNTILSTLSGIFSLFLSVFLKVDKFSIEKLFATLLTLSGVVLVSYSNYDKDSDGVDSVYGSVLAVIGAFLYGLYSVLVKKLIGSEDNLPMAMMFGFLGLFNFVFLWPIFMVLNLLSIEIFTIPSGRVFLFLLFNGIFGSFISDLLDSYSVVMTSPVINSIGLSLSIPFAMLSDSIRSGKHFTAMYIFGSIFVILGFLIANLASTVFENKLKSLESKLFFKFKSLFNKPQK